MKGVKAIAWRHCSLYCRLRDAIEYQKNYPTVPFGYVACCTCGTVKHWRHGDAGHWIDRGHGGMSGVYFDERNINFQDKTCNAGLYRGDKRIDVKKAYDEFMLRKYGQEVMDELRWLDKNQSYRGKLHAIAEMYRQMYFELCSKQGIKP